RVRAPLQTADEWREEACRPVGIVGRTGLFALHGNRSTAAERRQACAPPGTEVAMKRWLCSSISILMFAASGALAEFHLFQIEQLYSNADGTVQFIVMHEFTGSNGEHVWGGRSLTSTHAGVNKTFVFPNNLPSSMTANRRVLIATQGFAALGIVTPDYTIP